MPRSVVGIALGCWIAVATPWPAQAQLFQNSSGFAFALNAENQAGVQVMPEPDMLGVSLGAAASNVWDLDDTMWLEDFLYDASMLGGGSVTWGSASGNLALSASSKPQISPPVSGIGGPTVNAGTAEAGGQVYFRFTELGVITSQTLPNGTPVDVELNCRVQSIGFVLASLAAPEDTRVGASGECRITDNSGGFVRAELFVGGSEIKTQQLASAVGNTLEIEGVFRVAGRAFAGPQPCCNDYLGETQAGVEGSGGLWLGLPPGVDVTAASGHDYTVPIPEPGAAASAGTSALALFARVARRKRIVAST